MKPKYFFFILSCLFFLSNGQESSFKFNLPSKTEECLSEYFPDKTLVIFEISSTGNKIMFALKNPKMEIQEQKNNDTFNYPFTTVEGGQYEICMYNTEKQIAEINFSVKYGVGAKDYSSIARQKDLKPIDLSIEKLSDRAKKISQQIAISQGRELFFEAILSGIASKIIFFSSIVICIMVVVGYMETLYLKNFMRRRKII